MRGAIGFFLLTLISCAPLDEDEQLEKRLNIQENWVNCMAAYRQARHPTIHNGHSHSDGTQLWEMQDDLLHNRCRRVLGKYWIE